jgi:hypothetical protein
MSEAKGSGGVTGRCSNIIVIDDPVIPTEKMKKDIEAYYGSVQRYLVLRGLQVKEPDMRQFEEMGRKLAEDVERKILGIPDEPIIVEKKDA